MALRVRTLHIVLSNRTLWIYNIMLYIFWVTSNHCLQCEGVGAHAGSNADDLDTDSASSGMRNLASDTGKANAG